MKKNGPSELTSSYMGKTDFPTAAVQAATQGPSAGKSQVDWALATAATAATTMAVANFMVLVC